MLDRYLFRGKQSDSSEWLTGFLYGNKFDKYFILPYDYYDDAELMSSKIIDPATIGQCTGLKDKNGELIFEGDIINCIKPKVLSGAHKVVWYGDRWVLSRIKNLPEYSHNVFWLGNLMAVHIEIIGNVHDNPELLKECEKN